MINPNENSSFLIFSIIQNLNNIYVRKWYRNGNKKIANVKMDHFIKLGHGLSFKRVRDVALDLYKKLYNSVENNQISHRDIIIAYLHQALFSSVKIDILKLKVDKVKAIRELYTEKRLNEDKILIRDIITELKLNGLDDIFKVNVDGESIIYNLIKKEHISPIFYLQYAKKVLPNSQENNIFKSDNFIHFESISNIIFNILTEG